MQRIRRIAFKKVHKATGGVPIAPSFAKVNNCIENTIDHPSIGVAVLC